jgi:putative cell wall-binding protein
VIRAPRTVPALACLALLAGLLVAAVAEAPAASAGHPERISGVDRYQTAARVSASRFAAGVPVAYVVTGQDFPDALAAGVAAGIEGGPVLLTQPTSLPAATSAELDRLRPAEIVVVGGTGSVSDGVVTQLRSKTSGSVTRVFGGDRFATAAAVARHAFTSADTAYVANGMTFPDALAGVPAAVREKAPLLLVTGTTVPGATSQALTDLGVDRVVVLGGAGTVSQGVEDHLRALSGSTARAAGGDRFATSAAVSQRAFAGGAPVAYLATGLAAADALAAGPVAALAGGPVLLVRSNCIPPVVEAEIARLGASRLVILGGDRAVGMAVEDETRCPSGSNQPGAPTVGATPATATWDDDGPDPHIARFGHQWYAYTTGTTWGNHVGVLVSDRPDGGWRTITGQEFGSTALPSYPDWQERDTQWAPAVYRYGGRYIMFYAAEAKSRGEWCLSVAVADSPQGPFQDQTGATGPIVCQDHLGGVIDPHPFVDADGRAWLHFKNNDGMPDDDGDTLADDHAVSKVWAVRLSADGTRPVGSYHEVMAKDTERYPWQTTLDNPQMVLRGGVHYLFHTGGDYVGNDTYATGYAVCAGPLGPCPESHRILSSYGDVAGPGGGTVARGADGRWWISYHAWPKGCHDYSCGERKLFVAPLSF